jgi:hypothetical protein
MDKILFFDIDGVLNPTHYMNAMYKLWKCSFEQIKSHDEYGQLFFPYNCEQLTYIIHKTQAKIVISSTWRMEGLVKMQEMWKYRNLSGNVIDVTPNEVDVVNSCSRIFYDEVCRGDEIKLWIERNDFRGNYAIIDDTSDMLKEQEPFFVKTNEYCGLTRKDADKVIQILNK